mgnify:CR=1 FL=1
MFERYPADWWPLEVTGLYYEQLLADLDFRAALAVLFQDLAEPAERLKTLGNAIGNTPDFRSFQPSIVPEWAQYWNAYQDYYRAYNDVGQELSAFSARWHLPTVRIAWWTRPPPSRACATLKPSPGWPSIASSGTRTRL